MRRPLVKIHDGSMNPRNVAQNFATLEQLLGLDGQTVGTLEVIARLVGGQAFEGTVLSAADSTFRHALGRVPRMIVTSAPLASATGPVVRGVAAWTSENVYVRAGSDGEFAFVVT